VKQFERLFEPRAIAVVGVSEDPARPGSQTVNALLRNHYPGTIYPVNPKYAEHEGLKCYPSISSIEGDIDVALIGVPSRGVVGVVEECAQKRVPFVVVPSGGFRESGPEGAALQDKMVAIARKAGMRIVGPNCLGYVNIHKDVYAGFGSITRPPNLAKGSVSLVTQSGGFGYSIALTCAQYGIGFRNVIATGNEADIDTVEFIEALLDDTGTRIILAYIEGMPNGRALLEAGRRALALGKPLLVWKGGVTDEGARAAATHTANLTGSYDFYQALFKQAGIVEVRELHEAADYVRAFQSGRLPAGRRVAVMGGSGGSAIAFADAAEQSGLTFAKLGEDTQRRLAEVVPAIGSVGNPVDFTAGYIVPGNAERLTKAVSAVLADHAVDAACLNVATSSAAGCRLAAEVLPGLVRGTRKPLFVFQSTPAPDAVEALDKAGVPALPSPVRVARCIAMLARYREARERYVSDEPLLRQAQHERGVAQHQRDVSPLALSLSKGERPVVSESDAKAELRRIGIATTRDVLVREGEAAPFEALSPPLAVKIASADIAHKTEIGGVRLNIRTREELEAAMRDVVTNARTMAPEARIDGVIVSGMVTEGFELIAGAVNDAVFGPVVVVGAGGIYTEIMNDTACRIAPFDETTAREMIDELRCRRILDGARGRPALDVDAIARALATLSQYAWANREAIVEIDVNPLFALPAGAVAADALIILK